MPNPNFPVELWVPVTLVIPRLVPMTLWVLKGTALRGWNLAAVEPAELKFLRDNFESSVALPVAEDAEVDAEDWVDEEMNLVRMYEIPEPNADGLCEFSFYFEDADCEYVNADDAPKC